MPETDALQIDDPSTPRRGHLLLSTYRLQFHAAFTFRDALKIVPYLSDLGITHVYASPILKARPGSTHGYDVIDHHMLNPELGTDEDFDAFTKTLAAHDMKMIVDIVPNHMGVATNDNAWWNDCLRLGKDSKYAEYFDIDWNDPSRPQLRGKVLLPLLGKPYGEALEQGELRLIADGDALALTYYDRRFPISPGGYAIGWLKDHLQEFNGKAGDPRSFDRLNELLNQQSYRLAYWRAACDDINYRRFFDINDLAALRMERDEIFRDAHALLFQLLADGKIAGFRVDHPDGLWNPREYFRRLQEGAATSLASQAEKTPPQVYVVAEKILGAGEPLPRDWAVQGTTGYDFINKINGLFVDSTNGGAFSRHYNAWTGNDLDFQTLGRQKKRLILDFSFAGDLDRLADRLKSVAERNRNWRDFTRNALRDALRELIAVFPVYRTYITDEVSRRDLEVIEQAIGEAIENCGDADPAIFKLLRNVLLLNYPQNFDESARAAQREFVGKFQQLTAPVTAKGIEDTAFYVYNRLVSLNEVGGDPGRFGARPEELHRWLEDRQNNWPLALSPLSTHDTKRSEDVRARLNVLSEFPEEWWQRVARWNRLNEALCRSVDGKPAPDRNEEYLIYQTLLGAWPLEAGDLPADFVPRIRQFVQKALREAKVHSSWTDPNEEYEESVAEFVAGILSAERSPVFLRDFRAFQRRVSHFGLLNSLAQTLLRLTAPGVPDTYQGTELWDFSLVDPDNRRPVDYGKRERMLSEIRRRLDSEKRLHVARDSIAKKEDGRVKLFVTHAALELRKEYAGVFRHGQYIPYTVVGERREHIFSFARSEAATTIVVIVPRLLSRLGPTGELPLGKETWGDTRVQLADISDKTWRNVFTGEQMTVAVDATGNAGVSIAEALRDFPVALLVSRDG